MDQTATALIQPTTLTATVAKPRWLLSPATDLLMIGGGSLLLFMLAYLFVDRQADTAQISWTMFYLSFAVNNPHFAASYVLLYRDHRRELLRRPRLFWAAIIAPLLILGYMAACIAARSPRYLSYAVNFMYFTVGWHYIKQTYGTMVVTAARRGYYFNQLEGRFLRANLFAIWFMSFLGGNLGAREILHYGIGYHTFEVPAVAMTISYVVVGISLVAVLGLLGRTWLRTGQLPGWSAACSFAAIYVWYIPGLYHSLFWFTIPFFHSLQYLLFVITLKKNEFAATAARRSDDAVAARWLFARQALTFAAVICTLGFLAFDGVPFFLDTHVLTYDRQLFGPQLAMFVFITFINIHHYFIDNVLWRRDNPALKAYL